jgi:hypothetical protein
MRSWYLPRRRRQQQQQQQQLRRWFSYLRLRPMAWASIFIMLQITYMLLACQKPLGGKLYHWDEGERSFVSHLPSNVPPRHSNLDGSFEYHEWNHLTSNQDERGVAGEIKFIRPILTTFPALQRHQEKNSLGSFPVSGSPEIAGWTSDIFPDPLVDPVRCSLSFIPDSDIAMSRSYRLCDPDWVLGEVYLQEVALSLRNFSDMFSNQWAVGVVGENRRQLNTVLHSQNILASSSNQVSFTPIQKSGFTLIRRFFAAPRRLLMNEDKNTNEDRTNNRQISLGVAVVRKVCQFYA